MSDWYYAIDGKQFGPVSDRELHDLVGDGSLHPSDFVWQEGFVDWQRAETVAGLFVDSPPESSHADPARAFAQTVVGEEIASETEYPQAFASSPRSAFEKTPDELRVPLLVSGISNLIFAVGLGWTGCLLPFAVALVVLAVYEIKLFQKSNRVSTSEYAAEAKSLATYEIIAGIFNPPTLVCGIIVMVFAGKYIDRRHASA